MKRNCVISIVGNFYLLQGFAKVVLPVTLGREIDTPNSLFHSIWLFPWAYLPRIFPMVLPVTPGKEVCPWRCTVAIVLVIVVDHVCAV